jgi:hypothetical protein
MLLKSRDARRKDLNNQNRMLLLLSDENFKMTISFHYTQCISFKVIR